MSSKDRPPEEKVTGVVYRVKYRDCSFSYIEKRKSCWASWETEHDPAHVASLIAWLRERRFMKFVHVVVDCRHARG